MRRARKMVQPVSIGIIFATLFFDNRIRQFPDAIAAAGEFVENRGGWAVTY